MDYSNWVIFAVVVGQTLAFLLYFYYFKDASHKVLLTTESAYETTFYIVVTGGCTMSSPMNFFVKELLKSYGVSLMDTCFPDALNEQVNKGGNWEFDDPKSNRYFKEAGNQMNVSLSMLFNEAQEKKKSVVIKLRGLTPDIISILNHVIKPKLVFVYRGNILDRVVCEVRDCFLSWQKEIGYPVDSVSGKKDVTGCFKRRFEKSISTMAYLNVTGFFKRILNKMGSHMGTHVMYQRKMYDNYYILPKISSEDLWAFEFKDEENAYIRSVNAWAQVLIGWGFIPDQQRILKVMREYGIGSRRRKSHNETIYNLDELIAKFGHYPLFNRFLRLT